MNGPAAKILRPILRKLDHHTANVLRGAGLPGVSHWTTFSAFLGDPAAKQRLRNAPRETVKFLFDSVRHKGFSRIPGQLGRSAWREVGREFLPKAVIDVKSRVVKAADKAERLVVGRF